MSFNTSGPKEKAQNNKELRIAGKWFLGGHGGDAWAKMVQSTCH
jgi:hypothetical protein